MRINKKAVSPVIAVMLLVAVAVAAVGAYFLWYKSFQSQSQKDVEQQTGAISSKLGVTNVENDNVTFYITLNNGTEYDLIADSDDSLTVDDTANEADVQVSIKDSSGFSIVDGKMVGNPSNTWFEFTGTSIPSSEQGQIEIRVSEVNAGETYTIIVTAGGTTSTTKYTAV